MEIKYGRIWIIYNDTTGNGDFEDIYKCNTWWAERHSQGGINSHLAQAHGEMVQSWLNLALYRGNFKDLSTLNTHIEHKICKYKEENRVTFWIDIYTPNNGRYWNELA